MYACMHVCMHMCIYVCMYVSMYVRSYVCMHACKFSYNYADTCQFSCKSMFLHHVVVVDVVLWIFAFFPSSKYFRDAKYPLAVTKVYSTFAWSVCEPAQKETPCTTHQA